MVSYKQFVIVERDEDMLSLKATAGIFDLSRGFKYAELELRRNAAQLYTFATSTAVAHESLLIQIAQ